MLTIYLTGLGVVVFIDIMRYAWSTDSYRPNFFEWLKKSLIQNALWMLIFVLIYKAIIWIFS